MSDGRAPWNDPDRTARRARAQATIATYVGLGGAFAGSIDGIVLWAKRTVKDCPNGTFFPKGTTDFNCYAHPRAGEGIAILVISLGIGAVVLLLAYVGRNTEELIELRRLDRKRLRE